VPRSDILGQLDPNDQLAPLSRLVVYSYFSLTSFFIENLNLTITPTAIGSLAPDGEAEFSFSLLKIEGWVFWDAAM